MKDHPNDIVYTDGNDPQLNINNYNYPVQSFKIGDIINKTNNKIYKTVIHLRLEDFINNSAVIHPDCIVNIMSYINDVSYIIVLNKPKNDIEINYVNYLKSKFNIILQTGTILEDFHVMCQAETLVCSSSTLSWIASFLSDTVKTVYFPNKTKEPHESFNKPIDNTYYYDIKLCSKEELETFFKQDNLKNLDFDINLIENDFVLDGYFQSYSNLFHLKKWIVENKIDIVSKSNTFSDRTLVMHYRQGDYLRKDVQKELGLINLSNIDRAISIFKEKIDKVIIHSDDLNLLNRYENIDNLEIKISENEMDSFCDFLGAKNLVIPNSTFSLTAAILSENLNLLVRPYRWSRKYLLDDLTKGFEKNVLMLSNSFY
jgi:hypothetical protein